MKTKSVATVGCAPQTCVCVWGGGHSLSALTLTAAALVAAVAASAADGTWVARDGVGTSAASFADWSDTANWVDGTVPTSLDADTATLTAAAKAGQFICLGGADLALKDLSGWGSDVGAGRAVLVGDGSLQVSYAGDLSGVSLYAPWSRNGGATAASVYAGLMNAEICGDCSDFYFNTLLKGTVQFRSDRYASAAGGTRANGPLPNRARPVLNGGARVVLTAPRGTAEALTATFAQTEGSPFLVAVGDHETLPVGTAVTGAGVPDGTWLKRIFPDGAIELSAAVTATADANALSFAPLAVSATQTLSEVVGFNAAGGLELRFQKYGEADTFRVEVDKISDRATSSRTVAFATDDGFCPATLVLMADQTYAAYTWDLQNVHLELQGDIVGPKVQSRAATDRVRVTVPGSREQAVSNVVAFAGALTKDGTGTLRLGVGGGFASDAAIVVEEGVFAPFAAEGVTQGVIPNLTVRKGAGYRPTADVKVVNLTLEAGAKLEGSGDVTAQLVYDNLTGTLGDCVLGGGAYVLLADTGAAFGLVPVSGTAEIACFGDETVLTYANDGLVRVTGSGTLDVLLVGGGGGGGCYSGGGGGGGGFVYRQAFAVEPGLYSVSVGRGGAGGVNRASGEDGTKSAAFGLTALGGGGGGYAASGRDGASGGGGGAMPCYNGAQDVLDTRAGGVAQADGYGFAGGSSTNCYYTWFRTHGGGGGGAGGAGQAAAGKQGGGGGEGRACAISGRETVYGGGGAGGTGGYVTAVGGTGGGGDGGRTMTYPAASNGADGTDGLGGGGGGGGSAGDTSGDGGDGGDGVVILRFRPSAPTALPARDALATGGDVTHRKGYEIHTYRQDGTFDLSADAVVDILLVGGGGSGGYGCGGGGGGGGVVVLTNCFLFAGSYTVGVGAGGAAPTAWGSSSGAPSYILQPGVAATNLVAYGGGGGGSRAISSGAAADGGSGGGAGGPYSVWESKAISGGTGVAGQGHDGGSSLHVKDSGFSVFGGGGGGAGAPGTSADGTADPYVKGVGGRGVTCDYSGTAACYGGGGSGGSSGYQNGGDAGYDVAASEGGGGRGAGIKAPYGSGAYPGEDGTDGLGGGGGGGGGNVDNNAGGCGGKGGDGLVIIRYRYRPNGFAIIVK